jgi:hypothetical protein
MPGMIHRSRTRGFQRIGSARSGKQPNVAISIARYETLGTPMQASAAAAEAWPLDRQIAGSSHCPAIHHRLDGQSIWDVALHAAVA